VSAACGANQGAMSDLALALNQATTKHWTLAEAIAGCRAAGIEGLGVWREPVAEVGLATAAAMLADSGLTVTSLCRGGFFTGPDAAADNRRAVDEAAAFGPTTLVLVCGGLPAGSRDLPAARQAVADGLAALAPYAADRGVRLAVEPLHPMFAADRSVVNTLAQALDLAERFPADQVGVCVDTYHVWWDPDLAGQLRRAGPRIFAYQVCDWVVPLPADMLLGRGHLGDGAIDFRHVTDLVTAAGYTGFVEVEIFSAEVWDTPGDRTVATVADRFRRHLSRRR
jgi:sugar phosphate isomerase/epimerase